eukprot:TRINITY_DN2974_c0_g1_i1.p1 TRINITY_DN2974_c0_g1~~TRINITY_DN2974_c0_g1_i1.p1  ORF type:complete len:213 (-),score=31.97 TRINITY_DN2974_c0_g1_i1:33-671(-)
MESEGHDFLWKVVVIGDSGVGKSNLIDRYTKDQFRDETKTTIGVEFGHKHIMVDDKNIKAQLWDTAGQERFRALTRGYYRGSMGALLVYSVANKASFENCDTWLDELVNHADPGTIVLLVGNKTDLKDRDVTYEEGLEFARRNNLHFIETSAKDNSNVAEAFEMLVKEIYKQHVVLVPVGAPEEAPPTTGAVIELDGNNNNKNDTTEPDCKC